MRIRSSIMEDKEEEEEEEEEERRRRKITIGKGSDKEE